MNQIKHKKLLTQVLFASLTCDNQNKLEHYVGKHESVLLSQKEDCQSLLPDFGIDHFSIRTKAKIENIMNKPLVSFSLEAVKPLQSQYKQIKKYQTIIPTVCNFE